VDARRADRVRAVTKTFLLGVGCQKGGTTWVHEYLAGSPQYAPGYRKEYHVFDAVDSVDKQAQGRILERAAESVAQPVPGDQRSAAGAHRYAMYLNPEFYFDYFTGLLHRSPRTRLVADITPSYALLSAERYAGIRAGFAERSVTTLPMFLMRDPVERIWSQLRMHARLAQRPQTTEADTERSLKAQLLRPAFESRTRYHRTIHALDQAFGPDGTFYGFYESLFTDDEVRRLCGLAGIDFVTPGFDRRVHSSPKAEPELSDDTVRAVAEKYRDVYVAVAVRFPDVSLPDLWPSSRFVL
jgi:hypothetical protein